MDNCLSPTSTISFFSEPVSQSTTPSLSYINQPNLTNQDNEENKNGNVNENVDKSGKENENEDEVEENKLNLCCVCRSSPYKYRCPRCDLRSCSLACVQLHKQEMGCNGERDKTKFVALNSYDENVLYSDYTFLEDVAKTADVAQRSLRRDRPHQLQGYQKLLSSYLRRQQIFIQFMPKGMSRSKLNQTYANLKQRCVLWTLEIIFPEIPVSYTLHKIKDSTTLDTILKDQLLSPSSTFAFTLPNEHRLLTHLFQKPTLYYYLKCDFGTKKENKPIDASHTLKQVLKYAHLIEFPSFFIRSFSSSSISSQHAPLSTVSHEHPSAIGLPSPPVPAGSKACINPLEMKKEEEKEEGEIQ